MDKTFQARRLDAAAFAQAGATLQGRELLPGYKRLTLDPAALGADSWVNWQARGEYRDAADGSVRPALHLVADAVLPLTCQRCLGPVPVPVHIDAHFIFMPDEASAAALDETSEDDVLELTKALDIHALVEDELLLAQPLVPRHAQCPRQVRLSAQDDDFDAATSTPPHPFAALAVLKGGN
ncbi:MAG: DUF177 domain-containing protein [Burkholderiaceae bacterium]|jgi:uncharacterized protein|nr:DUF177 domain-containing protein [Burkholderiaceae bacterium]